MLSNVITSFFIRKARDLPQLPLQRLVGMQFHVDQRVHKSISLPFLLKLGQDTSKGSNTTPHRQDEPLLYLVFFWGGVNFLFLKRVISFTEHSMMQPQRSNPEQLGKSGHNTLWAQLVWTQKAQN